MGEKMIIAYEGIDLCGKDTQIKLICEKLSKDYKVKVIKFPFPEDKLTKFASNYNKNHINDNRLNVFFLYMAASVNSTKRLKKIKNESDILISNRFFWTTLAENNVFLNRKLDWIIKNLINSGDLIYPDKTIYLDTKLEERVKRVKKRDLNSFDRFSLNEEFDNLLREEYLRLSREYSGWIVTPQNLKIAEKLNDYIYKQIIGG
jgi:thymidylate kinase